MPCRQFGHRGLERRGHFLQHRIELPRGGALGHAQRIGGCEHRAPRDVGEVRGARQRDGEPDLGPGAPLFGERTRVVGGRREQVVGGVRASRHLPP